MALLVSFGCVIDCPATSFTSKARLIFARGVRDGLLALDMFTALTPGRGILGRLWPDLPAPHVIVMQRMNNPGQAVD
ncbi:MAG: hypothetical protein ACYCY9_09560 [Thiobacillus sp.]